MKTIAQQLNVTEFPFEIRDKNGNQIYFEDSKGYWYKNEYDSMEMKSTMKTLLGFGLKENTIPMEIKSTMKPLMGIVIKENSIPMEIKSTMKTLMGKL